MPCGAWTALPVTVPPPTHTCERWLATLVVISTERSPKVRAIFRECPKPILGAWTVLPVTASALVQRVFPVYSLHATQEFRRDVFPSPTDHIAAAGCRPLSGSMCRPD